jgi:hypothetical protein
VFTRRLLAAHPGPGGQVAELLASPASFLDEVPLAADVGPEADAVFDGPDAERRNA